jgi:molybdopterin biosynthesis enzyme
MLVSLVEKYSAEVINLGIAQLMTLKAIRKLLDRAVSEKVDLILSSAGVSVGSYDYRPLAGPGGWEKSRCGGSTCDRESH